MRNKALTLSARVGNLPIIELLTQKYGSDVLDRRDGGERTPLGMAIGINLKSEVIEEQVRWKLINGIINLGANVNQSCKIGMGATPFGNISPLCFAAFNGVRDRSEDQSAKKICKLLISKGAEYLNEAGGLDRILIPGIAKIKEEIHQDELARLASSKAFWTLPSIEGSFLHTNRLPNELLTLIAYFAELKFRSEK